MKNKIIMRKTLHEEFQKSFDYLLTIAIAPMGYGKTVGASQFLISNKINYIWLSLEVEQESYQNIWDTFCRQLEKTNTLLSKELYKMGFPIERKAKNYFFNIIKHYINNEKTILVIDDYHFTKSKEVDELLYLLVKAKIENLNILILTRTLPELNIEELKLKNECYIIKGDIFDLTKSEVAKYYRQNRIEAGIDVIEKTYEMSEGWISAVRLISEKFELTNKVESSTNMEILIKDTIISRYNEKEIMLLASLSIFDSFTLEEASYVLEIHIEKIRTVIEKNTFIRYDERNENYKIHNILNNYLLKHHIKDVPNRNRLYIRSGKWYIKNNMHFKGIQSFIKANDYKNILKEFEKSESVILFVKYPEFMYNAFDIIPEDLRLAHPMAYINYISLVITSIDIEKGGIILQKLEDYYKTSNEENRKIIGEIYLIKSIYQYNDIEEMSKSIKIAYELLEGKSRIASINRRATLSSISILFSYYKVPGKFKYTVDLSENFKYYNILSGGSSVGITSLMKAEYYLEILNIEKAKLYAEKSIIQAKSKDQFDIILLGNFVLSRIAVFEGKYAKGILILDNILQRKEIEFIPITDCQFEICKSYIYALLGEYDNISDWIKKGDFSQSRILFQNNGINYLIYGKSLVLNKEYLKLELLCQEMARVMKVFNNVIGFLHTYIFESIVQYNLYGIDSAIEPLKKALDIGEKDNIYMLFIEYGEDLFKIIESSHVKGDYINKLTLNFKTHIKSLQKEKNLNINLTDREQEIISHVIDGKSNKEIASTLFIAEVTVKKTLTNLYQKLGVKNRVQLISKHDK